MLDRVTRHLAPRTGAGPPWAGGSETRFPPPQEGPPRVRWSPATTGRTAADVVVERPPSQGGPAPVRAATERWSARDGQETSRRSRRGPGRAAWLASSRAHAGPGSG